MKTETKQVNTMKTSTVEDMHESDDVSLENEVSNTKRSVLWFFGAFLIIAIFAMVAFFLMNMIQFPFSVGFGGPTGAAGN